MRERNKKPEQITIYDVARAAGVSYSTVSRVLNNSANVRADKYNRVIQAMAQLGFSVNQQARSLAGGNSQTIGVIVGTSQNQYTGLILQGIQAELAEINHDLLLYSTLYKKLRSAAYIATLTRGIADGFLLLSPDDEGSYVDVLQQQNRPCVIIEQRSSEVACPIVKPTNRQGAYDATRYLITLGHRRIGFITGTDNWQCSLERLDGYTSALHTCGIPVDPLLIEKGNFTQSQGYLCAKILLSLADRPTAIFASNDVSAIGAMEAARDLGLTLVRDVSFVGFDDVVVASEVHPPLTTVRQPLELLGRTAVQLLMEYVCNPDLPAKVVEIPTELIIRKSCQPPCISASMQGG